VQFIHFRRKFLDASVPNKTAICKYNKTSLIRTANYPDRLGPSGKIVENSTKLTCRQVTGYRIKYSTVLWLLEFQIRHGRKGLMQVRTVNSDGRTSNCQCGLFSKKNSVIRIFCISGWFTVQINPNKLSSAVRESVSSNRIYSLQSKNSQRTRSEQKLDEIGVRWRRFQNNHRLNVHSKQPRLHHKHELQQTLCIYCRVRQLWCAKCTTQILKRNWIFKTIPLWCAWWRNRLLTSSFFSDAAWLFLVGYANCQNRRYWC
jgi:hypothetical protein